MKSIENIFVETLLNRAEAEQEIANRLYKGSAKKESYLVATVTAQVLRNVAGALQQAENIHKNQIKGISATKVWLDEAHNIPTDPESEMVKGKGFIKDPPFTDPDVFRFALDSLVESITESGYQRRQNNIRLEKAMQHAEKVLEDNPISPARAVQAKYAGLLREVLETVRTIDHAIQEVADDNNMAMPRQLTGSITELIRDLREAIDE